MSSPVIQTLISALQDSTLMDSNLVTKLKLLHPAVHVDVDFIGPFFLTMKKNAKDIWIRLPPPVQQGLPYVGAATGTGLIVWKIQAGRLRKEVSTKWFRGMLSCLYNAYVHIAIRICLCNGSDIV